MRHTFLLCLCFLSIFLRANDFKGIILDKKTNEPIGFASILVKGTTKGTVTNDEGEFLIKSDSKEITIICSFLGCKKDSFVLNPSQVTLKVYVYSTI